MFLPYVLLLRLRLRLHSRPAHTRAKAKATARKITAVEIDAPEEQPFGVPNFPKYIEALIGRTDGNIDAISTATMSRNGIQEAVNKALEKASGPKEESKKGFTPGTYEGEGKGYSETAPVKVKKSQPLKLTHPKNSRSEFRIFRSISRH